VSQVLESQPRLSDLAEPEREERFARLQERLAPVWRTMRLNDPRESIVVVPSIAPPPGDMGSVVQAYEERLLFLLLLLRQPCLQLIYVTGREVEEAIVDYYLALLPGVIPSQARARLHMIAAHDGSPRPLATKLLQRPRVLEAIRSRIPDRGRCHLVPFTTTRLERDLALALGIPLYGADPRHLHFGTKTGCRRLFEQAGVAHPLGHEGVADVDGVVEALASMRAAKPHMRRAIVKHNDGVAGRGNAAIDLQGLCSPGSAEEPAQLRARVEQMELEHPGTNLIEYLDRLAEDGGIVEEHIGGVELRSPSVQLRISPFGEVEVLSTHDQLLGGRSGQTYLGCRFPADFGYARAITAEATKVAERLAVAGVLGRFAVDFVVVRDAVGTWTPYAIELNLRKGGTTHPFLTLQFLTDGTYDAGTAIFTAPSGREKHLVATDHLESELLQGLSIHDLFDIAVRHRLHFDPARQVGVVFHMMSTLTELGRTGMTAVGDTPEQAEAAYRRAERLLVEEAEPPREPALPAV
jgi:pheganomycin biosynthesis PGM1-like protein/ATP-grasp domain-containing protein